MKLLTTKDLSERWSISPGTIKNWRSQGKGPPYIKYGTSKKGRDLVRYRIEDIEAYEKQNISR